MGCVLGRRHSLLIVSDPKMDMAAFSICLFTVTLPTERLRRPSLSLRGKITNGYMSSTAPSSAGFSGRNCPLLPDLESTIAEDVVSSRDRLVGCALYRVHCLPDTVWPSGKNLLGSELRQACIGPLYALASGKALLSSIESLNVASKRSETTGSLHRCDAIASELGPPCRFSEVD